MKESYPLSWPDGWLRTRPQDRRAMAAWKRTANHYRDALEKELGRTGVLNFVVSSNVPLSVRGSMTLGVEPLDPGVAVWFSRKVKEDFAWQDALDIHEPAPTAERINKAYQQLARQYHPDGGSGDKEMFLSITRHRDNALRWINRRTDQNFNFVIPCDAFKEVRHNLAAILYTLQSIRRIERCGAGALLERAYKGFSALPEHVPVAAREVVHA